MKAITVRQPWARAIAVGAKNVENRGRATAYRGEIAIHAGKTPSLAGDEDLRVLRQFGPDPRVGAPVGAVVAVADLVGCHETRKGCTWSCHPWGEFEYNGKPAFHLVLADVRALPRPVHVRGSLQVPWTLPAEVAEQVRVQLGEVDACSL
jgi:hypothetical protein